MDGTTLGFLLRPEGQRLLRAACSSYDDMEPMALNRRLRELDTGYGPDEVAAALSQVRLRRAATTKFGASAQGMYFTAAGLEQATSPAVARHRATRARAAGLLRCLDLTCGIGSDLLALADADRTVRGVDRDPVTVRVAAANLRAMGAAGSVRCADAEAVNLAASDLVLVDPARRRGTTRVFDPRAFSPPWTFVAGLLAAAATADGAHPRVVAKLAPGLDHALLPSYAEAEWVSLDGALKEIALWSPAPSAVRRRATVLSSTGTRVDLTDTGLAPGPPPVAAVGHYVYEPDPAVVRAHLVEAVVDEVAGWLLDPHIAYVSSDTLLPTGAATCFRVVEVLPYREKALRTALRARGIGVLTIKKRGVAVTPEVLRRRLRLRGSEQATLLLSRTPQSAVALLVERV